MGNRIMFRQDDGILAAQRRLRRLGRIRTGWSEPYQKDGRELRRPVRSKTIVLSSAQRVCLDAAADQWGGTVERWQPQGNNPEVWRLVTERDGIEAILPPGDPLNQSMEMWSGGGCTRRCDGVTDSISGQPCLCAAQFGADFHLQKPVRGVPQVCKPTSRLEVFLDLADFGLWGVETHSYYAMLEMAGTVDLIKAKVGPEAIIPIRLRIDPRSRLVDGKSTPYPVIVVELQGRGVVAQILSGAVDGLAIEPAAPARAAITATAEPAPAPTPPAQQRDSGVVFAVAQPPEETSPRPATDEEMVNLRILIYSTKDEPDARALFSAIGEIENLSKDQRAALVQDFWVQKRRLTNRATDEDEATAARVLWPSSSDPSPYETGPVDPPEDPPLSTMDEEQERAGIWMQIMGIAGARGWDATQTAAEMVTVTDRTPLEADSRDMNRFLNHLKGPGR